MSGVDCKVYIEDPTTALLTYTSFRLYSDTSPGGAFSTLVATTTIVAGTYEYTVNDSAGTTSTFYRWRYYNATGPVQSSLSPVILPAAFTMRRLRVQAAQQGGLGFSGTCSATGAITYLEDVTLRDNGVDPDFLQGAWIYRPDAASASDKVRRIKAEEGFDEDSGRLYPVRAWANAPADDEEYHVFTLFPPTDQAGVPYSWDRAIRDGLADVWYVDLLTIGVGTTTNTRRWNLDEHAAYLEVDYCRRCLLRFEDDDGNQDDYDVSTNGWYWQINENGGSYELELSQPPSTNETVLLEINRRDTSLYVDTDIVGAREDVATAAVLRAAYRALEETLQPGKYGRELVGADAAFRRLYRPPSPIVRGL